MNMNIHNNTSAGTVLQAIRGERTASLLSNNLSRSQTFVHHRRFPDWCSAYENSSIDDTTPPAIAVVSDFTSRRSSHLDHF